MDREPVQDAAPAGGAPLLATAALDPAGVDALVEALRTARLTVLTGAAGSGKSRLLWDAVRPLLHRRADDASTRPLPPADTGPGGLDLLERRRSRSRPRELVIWCDRWDGSPNERLHACLDEATGVAATDPGGARTPVASRAEALGAERGARLLFVFDHGDRLAPATVDSGGPAAEYDALVHALCGVGPSVHVLVSARDDALPPSVRLRLDRHDTRVLRLPDRRAAEARLAQRPGVVPVAPAWTPPPAVPDERPLQRDDVYASIIARLAVIGDGERELPWGSGGHAAPGAAATGGSTAHAGPAHVDPSPRTARLQASAAAWLAGWQVPGWLRSRTGLAGVALSTTVVVGGLLWQDRSPPASRPEASARSVAAARAHLAPDSLAGDPKGAAAPVVLPPSPAERDVPAPPADPPIAAADIEAGSDADIAAQLWRGMAAHGVALPGAAAPGDAVAASSGRRRLTIVSYDALRTLAETPGTAKTARVIAPLYTAAVQVLARADSPLTFIHELSGRRINVGAAQGRRAVTAAAVYRQLFDAPLAPAQTSMAGLDQALAELLEARSLDAIVLTEPQPSVWLARLPEAQRRSLKFLGLAPDAPSTRRALRAYLPATLHSGPDGAALAVPTLGVMSFLVADAAAPPAAGAPIAAAAAQALCQALPGLRRTGHPTWREVDPALRLPLPLRYDDRATAALERCEATRSATAPRPPISVSQADSPSRGEHE